MTVEPPNTVPWPPLIYASVAGIAWLLGRLVPLGVLPAFGVFGVVIVATGLGFDLGAMITMMRHRANILPHRAVTALVTSGPFAVSRNPIYLGNMLVLIGLSAIFGNVWFLPAAFAAAWGDYAGRVPRWFRLPR